MSAFDEGVIPAPDGNSGVDQYGELVYPLTLVTFLPVHKEERYWIRGLTIDGRIMSYEEALDYVVGGDEDEPDDDQEPE